LVLKLAVLMLPFKIRSPRLALSEVEVLALSEVEV
jgi:hypothetical protein